MAEVTDARQRVLAARAELDDEFQRLNASARSAADIPAKIRKSPAKAAAIAGGAAFLLLKGPQRVFGLGRRAIRGKDAPLPSKMLPEEIDKSLRKMGSDGEKVRGLLERDFADYVAKAHADRRRVRRLVVLTIAQPILTQLARRGASWLLSPEEGGFERRLAELRARAEGTAVDTALPPQRATAAYVPPTSVEPTAPPSDAPPAI